MKPEKYFYYRQKNCEYAGMESDPANVFHSSEELLNYQLGEPLIGRTLFLEMQRFQKII